MTSQSTALAVAPRFRAPTYVRHAVLNPISVSAMIFATCVGATTGGALGVLAAPALLVAAACLAWLAPVQRAIEHHVAAAARRDRERARLRSLHPVGPLRQGQYDVLRELVDEIERADPGEARRFELQDLLDAFVRIAVVHARCQRAASGSTGPFDDLPALEPTRSARTRGLITRRALQRDENHRRIAHLADQLEAIEHMIRLVAQRVACPAIDEDLDRDLDRRLWELEQIDTALEHLP